ncbi:MAG TPA: AsmA family protein [Burkholderiales bacterium]|nr:AsmA family protein [Burkholderiales bacterium]
MKAIRISLYVIGGLLVLVVLAAAIFALTFNPNRYKGQIERLVKEQTGRTLSLKGDLQVAVYPALGAKVNGVTLSEHESPQEFLALDSAHASVALLPLLRGQAIVDRIRISGLKARIVKDKDGRYNFSDLLEAKAAQPGNEPQKPGKSAKKDEPSGEKQSVGFDIAGIQIDRSSVTYVDRQGGQEIALSDLTLSTGRIADKADGKLELKADVKGKNPDVDVKVDLASGYQFDLPAKSFAISRLDAKLTGAAAGITSLNVNAKGDVGANPEKNEYRVKGFTLDVKGVKEKQNLEAHIAAPELVIAADMAKGAAITADLKLKDATQDLEAKLKLAGFEGSAKALVIPQLNADVTMTGPNLPNKSVKIPISGSLRADLEKQTVNADLSSKFDESNIQAKLGLAKFTPPSYLFDINVDKINLDRYTGDEQKAAAAPKPAPPAEGKAPEKPAPTAQKKEEDSPVDLSFLKDLNANGRLAFGALQVKGLKLANVKAEVKAANGRLDVAPHSANLYEGSVSGAIAAQADGRVTVKETLNGVAIGPLLRDFAQKDTLEGKGTLTLDVAAAGKTVNTMKKSLGGSARVQLRDGAIKGINLAEVFRKAKTALLSQSAREEARQAQQTDFSELIATFAIKNGVAHNEDLDVKAPLFRITGRGDVDIGNSAIDYVTKATVVATTKGQGGADLEQLSGLTVPVHLSGPFDNMKYDVNYSAVAADALKSKVGDRVRSKIEERLGVGKPPAEAPSGQGGTAEAPRDPRLEKLDKLKGLFGR